MKVLIGDKVRFLNEVGGGEVCRIEGDNLLYVTDEDGFEIPALRSEVVVVERGANEKIEREDEQQSNTDSIVEESADEGEPKLVLGFIKEKEENGNVELYFINDSNFFVFTTVGIKQDNKVNNVFNSCLEPNTKYKIDSFSIGGLDGKSIVVQTLMFKKSYSYSLKAPVEAEFKISGSKLMKVQSYSSNEYFNENAILYYVLKDEVLKKLENLSSKDIKNAINEKSPTIKKVKEVKSNSSHLLEIDLHIHELLDDTRGLSNKDMLDYQLQKFHEVMKENEKNKNKKIVFIHGKGNGVLKSEILKSLKSKYKWHSYQDASFREYGFGATMVII